MRTTKSYWDKYAQQRRAQRSRMNLLPQRGAGSGRRSTPTRTRPAVR